MRRKKRRPFPLLLGTLLLICGLFLLSIRLLSSETKAQGSTFSKTANQSLTATGQNLPLYLQTDPRWGNLHYGSGSDTNDLATNGCAITSLAMILSFYRQQEITPPTILNWAQDTYYVTGQGSAWSIFPAFAQHFQLNYENLGLDSAQIQARLDQNQPLILSVKSGEFTSGGHILVIKKDVASAKIIVYDPNDDEQKNHYQKRYDLSYLLNQTANAWSFSAI